MDFLQRKFSYFIIGISIALTVGIFLYGTKMIENLQSLRASEIALFEESQDLDQTLQEVQRALGFGGFIHNIKVYLVHRKPLQLYILEANVRELEEAFEHLESLFNGLESARPMRVLEDFVVSVRQKLELLETLHGQDYSASQLDELMGLEDPDILSAIVTLESLQSKNFRSSIHQIKQSIDQLVRDLIIASILLPIILMFGGLLVWMLNHVIAAKEELEVIQEDLADNQRLLEATGQLTKVGGWELEPQSRKAKWTREMYRLHGLHPDQHQNPSFDKLSDIYPKESLDTLDGAMDQAHKTGEPFDLELPFVHSEAGARLARIVCRPVLDTGKVTKFAGAFQDITEIKIFEERLRQAEKMDSIGHLAGGVAHDYNNMLGVIIGYAELAMMKIEPASPLHDDLDQILTAAKRSRDITRQLLAYARKQTLVPKVIDLNEAVEGMLKMLQRLIGENISLAWLPRSGLWPVEVDSSLLDQILANLCINARDAIDDIGKMTIETNKVTFDTTYCKDRPGIIPGDFVMLAISDNGCGMDKATQAKIFEPFFTTKQVGEGTGLGLATVYGAVRQSNGFINVYSEPGKGTTFKVYLPRHRGQPSEAPKPHMDTLINGKGETVLLVEDEPLILNLAERILGDLGYKTLVSESPSEAIKLAKSHPGKIHLLITDVIMPEMNGRELADHLRFQNPRLKCLFMSGYTANVTAHHGVLEKGIHFIHKPFSRHDFGLQVRKVLGSDNEVALIDESKALEAS